MRRLITTLILAIGCAAVAPVNQAIHGQSAQQTIKQQTIKVHGHWTIEVRTPDGTLAQRREVENSLTDNGRKVLAKILGLLEVPESWELRLSIIPEGSRISEIATILEASPGDTSPQPGVSHNLNVRVDDGAGTITLSGSTQLPNDMTGIAMVQSQVDLPKSGILGFTEANLTPVVQVAPGQIVQVSVTFSFGS